MKAIRTSIPTGGLKGYFSVVMAVTVAGIICGTIIYALTVEHVSSFISSIFDGIYMIDTLGGSGSPPFLMLWVSLLSGSSKLLFVSFLLGFSAIGQPIARIIPFLKGIGLGCSAAAMYSMYQGKAVILIAITAILPQLLITSALLLGCRESIKLSNQLAGYAFSESTQSPLTRTHQRIQYYLLKFVILFGIIILSSLLAAVLQVTVGRWILSV